jgi:hypothetical protein
MAAFSVWKSIQNLSLPFFLDTTTMGVNHVASFTDSMNLVDNNLSISYSLLHILPFCEGPNEKPEGFAKQKQKT